MITYLINLLINESLTDWLTDWLTNYIAFIPTSVNRSFADLDTHTLFAFMAFRTLVIPQQFTSIMEQLSHAIRPFVYFVPVDGGYLYTLHVYGRKASWNKM